MSRGAAEEIMKMAMSYAMAEVFLYADSRTNLPVYSLQLPRTRQLQSAPVAFCVLRDSQKTGHVFDTLSLTPLTGVNNMHIFRYGRADDSLHSFFMATGAARRQEYQKFPFPRFEALGQVVFNRDGVHRGSALPVYMAFTTPSTDPGVRQTFYWIEGTDPAQLFGRDVVSQWTPMGIAFYAWPPEYCQWTGGAR